MDANVTSMDGLHPTDSDAFAAQIEPFRRQLQAYCYRMLGSVQEAEELAQEALMRAWQRRETYEGRGSLRAWLYKIATNACLNVLERRPRRSLPIGRGSAAKIDEAIPPALREPVWLEPFPDEMPAGDDTNPEAVHVSQESVTLAMMVALHRLPARQRAVLILSDVLEFSAKEVADLLEVTASAAKSALFRARQALAASQTPTDADVRVDAALLQRYVDAWQRADVGGLVALLKSDASFSMPPIPAWYQGREAICWLIGRTVFAGTPDRRWKLSPTRANGRNAFGLYQLDYADGVFKAYGIQVVTFAGGQVADIMTCINPALFVSFKLPATC